MQIHLKIKVVSLAAEARIIRRYEQSLKRQARWTKKNKTAEKAYIWYSRYESLHSHRCKEVRSATRLSHLAYGFLRGVDYRRMETKCFVYPNFNEVEKIALRFSDDTPQVTKQRFAEWIDGADLPNWARPRVPIPVAPQKPGILAGIFGGKAA